MDRSQSYPGIPWPLIQSVHQMRVFIVHFTASTAKGKDLGIYTQCAPIRGVRLFSDIRQLMTPASGITMLIAPSAKGNGIV